MTTLRQIYSPCYIISRSLVYIGKLPKQSFHHLYYEKSYPEFLSNIVISVRTKFKNFKPLNFKTNRFIKSYYTSYNVFIKWRNSKKSNRNKKLTTQDRKTNWNEDQREKRYYRLAEGPLLQQILVQRHAMIPTTTKISVVIKKPIPIRCFQIPIREKWFPKKKKRSKTTMWFEWFQRENWLTIKRKILITKLNWEFCLFVYLWTLEAERSHGSIGWSLSCI